MAIVKDPEFTEAIEPADNDQQLQIPSELPVLPLRDIVIYPFMIVPLFVSREKSIRAVDEALGENRMILLASQKDLDKEEPTAEDLYSVGTAAVIMRMLKLPDGRIRILVQGLTRAQIESVEASGEYLRARLQVIQETPAPERSLEVEALIRNVRASMEKAANLGKNISPEVMAIIANLDDAGRLADLSASNLELKVEDAQSVLDIADTTLRLRRVNELLNKEIEVLTVQQEINTQARADIDRSQREFYLRQQLKAIQTELGEGNELAEEIAQFREKIEAADMPKHAEEEALRQLKKLERMHPDAAETATLRNWMEIMTDLPWSKASVDNLDLHKAEKILNEDHYGLEKVKDRIIEALAVRKLKEKPKGPILCLVGPPGVGKTSLGRSIARATGRKFTRMSLGGVRDEAEIRGHRRTYIGSLPGKIVQNLAKVRVRNPLFLLDEVDKMAMDFRGDPASALLEVLDPEQNSTFSDHYLEVDFDLSDVMFVTTANRMAIPGPLLDRMEVIRLPGYTEDEKTNIAERYLIPKQIKGNGLKKSELSISEAAVRDIIRYYTREAGVRNLEREISKICRKVVKSLMLKPRDKSVAVVPRNLDKFLGVRRYRYGIAEEKDQIGQATGLAWTEVGGELLTIEAAVVPGKGKLTQTGQLGDVMQESVQAALTVVRSRAAMLGIALDFHEAKDIHVHVPEGATPKDGPSAGIGMSTALVSALTGVSVHANVAMTGEITLRGEVLPIGGLKEKLLAAHRGGIATVIIPSENEKDLVEIPKNIKQKLEIRPVRWIDEVLEIALHKMPAPLNVSGEKQVEGATPKKTDDEQKKGGRV